MGQLTAMGKVFFWVGVALGITAAIHLSLGNYGVGSFMMCTAALEFWLAQSNRKKVEG